MPSTFLHTDVACCAAIVVLPSSYASCDVRDYGRMLWGWTLVLLGMNALVSVWMDCSWGRTSLRSQTLMLLWYGCGSMAWSGDVILAGVLASLLGKQTACKCSFSRTLMRIGWGCGGHCLQRVPHYGNLYLYMHFVAVTAQNHFPLAVSFPVLVTVLQI